MLLAREGLESVGAIGGDLTLADHVSRLDAGDSRFNGMESLEAHHRACDPFDETVVLFKDVVQIFDLPDLDRSSAIGEFQDRIHRLKPGQIGTTLVYDDALGHAISADRPPEEAPRGGQIAPLGEHEVKGFPHQLPSDLRNSSPAEPPEQPVDSARRACPSI